MPQKPKEKRSVPSRGRLQKAAVSSVNRRLSKTENTPVELQQRLLDVFAKAFPSKDPNELRETIQNVKANLYNRDFANAFASAENQEAYCLRWSPSRTLAYLDLLCDIPEIRTFFAAAIQEAGTNQIPGGEAHDQTAAASREIDVDDGREGGDQTSTDEKLRVSDVVNNNPKTILAIGGGAGAEIVAFANYAACLPGQGQSTRSDAAAAAAAASARIHVSAVDVADWSHVLNRLAQHCVLEESETRTDEVEGVAPTNSNLDLETISKEPFSYTFTNADVLSLGRSELISLLEPCSTPPLVTLLFTLNELYTSSMSKTTSFLLTLTTVVVKDTMLLVVDSPGSYSTVKLGDTEKKYPMAWLLDHTLLEATKDATKREEKTIGTSKWEKISEEESRWWRMNRDKVRYKVPGLDLEDMRMQWHLYRRTR